MSTSPVVGSKSLAVPVVEHPTQPVAPVTARVSTAVVPAPPRDLWVKGPAARADEHETFRQQVRDALGSDSAICGLSDDAIAAATTEEKVAMLRRLMSKTDGLYQKAAAHVMRGGAGTQNYSLIPVFKSRQKAIARILGAAQNTIEFDKLSFRISYSQLQRVLSGNTQRQVAALYAGHRTNPTPGDWDGYLEYMKEVTGLESAGKNTLEFLVDGETVVPRVIRDLARAQESIHCSVFQLQMDEVGLKFCDILKHKAQKGLEVRLLVDEQGTGAGRGNKEKLEALVADLRAAGVHVAVNQHPLSREDLDHRKILVIDGKIGYTGGMNIGHHYQVEWHDQQTRVDGPAVGKLQEALLTQFAAEGGHVGEDKTKYFPQLHETVDGIETHVLNHAGNGQDRNIKAAYLRALYTAEKEIRIASPYFGDTEVIEAMCAAARRGVKVQFITPRENDLKFTLSMARAYYPQMIEAGVEVYEYLGRMAHQKVATIDGKWATVGSSNLDARSLEYNDELNLICVDERLAEDINAKLFEVDLQRSERITAYQVTLMDRLCKRFRAVL